MIRYVQASRLLLALLLTMLVASDVIINHAETGQAVVASAQLERVVIQTGGRGGPRTVGKPELASEVLAARSQFLPSPTPLLPPDSPPQDPAPTSSPPATPAPLLEDLGIFRITAYSDSPLNGTNGAGITRTGVRTRWGVVAVDPSVIPLRSRLKIDGMGDMVFTALDTGGGVRGRWVDVWYRTDWEAIQHGVRERRVYLLRP